MAKTTNGLSSNNAAALSYLLGLISGIFFFVTSKDKYVRFHALQSTITSIGFMALNFVLGMIGLHMFTNIINLVSLILFIFLIIQAYQGKEFKLLIIGDIASKNA